VKSRIILESRGTKLDHNMLLSDVPVLSWTHYIWVANTLWQVHLCVTDSFVFFLSILDIFTIFNYLSRLGLSDVEASWLMSL
jgi:hypothetical protein